MGVPALLIGGGITAFGSICKLLVEINLGSPETEFASFPVPPLHSTKPVSSV